MAELLSEKLRPEEISDLMQRTELVRRFERMVESGSIMNMLFYGDPGIGKTSAARVLLKTIDADVFEVNGSVATGVDQVRHDVESYCRSLSLYGQPKVCFIDECEYLSANAQAALRGIIEGSRHARFLLTANNISRLHPALKSRCMPVCFDLSPCDAPDIVERLLPRYQRKIREAGLTIDEERLRAILFTEFPDLRRVANRIEFEALLLT